MKSLERIIELNETINQNHVLNITTVTTWALYSDGTITYQGKWTFDVVFKYTLAFDTVASETANEHFHFPMAVKHNSALTYCILPSRSLCEDFRNQMEQYLLNLKVL